MSSLVYAVLTFVGDKCHVPLPSQLEYYRLMRTLLIAPLLLLSACADPLELCKQDAVKDLRIVQALIADTQATLDRGYAIQTETRAVNYTSFCLSNGHGGHGHGPKHGRKNAPKHPQFTFCNHTQPVITKTPVAVDLDAERRKLTSLRRKEAELARESDLSKQRCELAHPISS